MRMLILLLLILCSCNNLKQIEKLEVSYGIYSPVTLSKGNVAFLGNLKSFYKVPALVQVNFLGEIEYLYKLDCETENITIYPYFKLISIQDIPVLFFKKDKNKVEIHELFSKDNVIITKINNDSYGTLFFVNNQTIYIKSGAYNYKEYLFTCYNLDNSMGIISTYLVNLGFELPLEPLFIENKIFYHRENILYEYNILTNLHTPVYKFESEIIKVEFNKQIFVLLEDSIFIFSSNGEPIKGFGFKTNDSSLLAQNLIFTNSDNFIVQLRTGNSYQFKYIQDLGVSIKEHIVDSKDIVGDSVVMGEYPLEMLMYSDSNRIYYNSF